MKTFPLESTETTDLQRHLASQIIQLLQQQQAGAGTRISESRLAAQFKVSRSPVRAALKWLESQQWLETEPYRGYRLTCDAAQLPNLLTPAPLSPDEALYQEITGDLFLSKLPSPFSEAELARHYQSDKVTLRGVLNRLASEGILQRELGYKWSVCADIGSYDSQVASYRFRLLLEPHALACSDWQLPTDTLQQLRQEQLHLLQQAEHLNPAQLFNANAHFHETLISGLANPFASQAIKQQNQLRRIPEIKAMKVMGNPCRSLEEHVAIIDALLSGQQQQASALLQQHLQNGLATLSRNYQRLHQLSPAQQRALLAEHYSADAVEAFLRSLAD